MSKIFEQPTGLFQPLHTKDKCIWVQIRWGGNNTARRYALIGNAGGEQPLRTQYDMAADGTQYLLAAGKGLGNYSFRLLEGPFKVCNGSSTDFKTFASEYKSLGKFKNRRITITVPLREPASGINGSTRNSAIFDGVINLVRTETQIEGNDGFVTVVTLVNAAGVWTS